MKQPGNKAVAIIGAIGALLILTAAIFALAQSKPCAELFAKLTGDEYQLAQLAAERHDAQGFLQHIDQAIAKDPKNINAYLKRGSYYFYTAKDYGRAEQDFSSALSLDPQNRYRLLEAQCLRHLGKNLAAFDEAAKCLNMRDLIAPALCEQAADMQADGIASQRAGDQASAAKAFDAATDQYHQAYLNGPEWAPTLMGMADLDVISAHKYKSATVLYTEALRYASKQPRPFGMEDVRESCYFGRGNAYALMDDNDDALPDFEQCLVLAPNNEQYIAAKARCLNNLHRYPETIEFLRPLADKFPSAKDNLTAACQGLVLKSSENPDSAGLSSQEKSALVFARSYLEQTRGAGRRLPLFWSGWH